MSFLARFPILRLALGCVALTPAALLATSNPSPMPLPAYRHAALPVETRVADLLGRMTLEEKVGQIMMWDARAEDLSFITTRQPGSILHILGEKINRAQDLAAQNRLGIPLLVGEDGIHGHSFWKGATIFPTQLSLAASWDAGLMEKVGRVTAEEMVPTGVLWTFSPVLCLTRDLRWGRVGETFGEDPYLIGEFAAAMIRGYQGKGLDDPTAVLATAKHIPRPAKIQPISRIATGTAWSQAPIASNASPTPRLSAPTYRPRRSASISPAMARAPCTWPACYE